MHRLRVVALILLVIEQQLHFLLALRSCGLGVCTNRGHHRKRRWQVLKLAHDEHAEDSACVESAVKA